jgi:flagellar biosynthesis component FlhA
MSTIVESVIKSNPVGRWYIELTDTMKDDEERIICLDVFEYAEKIEVIGAEYNQEIEIAWSSDDDVTPEQINEVRQQMMAYEAEQEAQKENAIHQENSSYLADGTPNFQAQ